jgi:phage tail-like protein
MSENRAPRSQIQRPHANSNFLVDLGYGDPSSFNGGFCEVIFPEFRIDVSQPAASHSEQASDGRDNGGRSQSLILRRGATGMLDLYEWWNKARSGKAPEARTVKVTLLAEDLSTVVCTWYFRRARPVSLSYSPLNAMQGGVLIESIELAFDSMEMR